MKKKLSIFIILNIFLLFVLFILTPIAGQIAGFANGFLGAGEFIGFILSFIVIEFFIGWLPYKLFIKPKATESE
jgi:hypothetical protein